MPILLSRNGPSQSGGLSSSDGPVYIAGIVVASVLVLALAIGLGIRTYRKRSLGKREELRNGAFLSVKGLVREDGNEKSNATLPDSLPSYQGNTFSREKMDSSVVMPQKAVLRQDASPDEILSYYETSGNMPRPFTPKPFSFALEAAAGGQPSPRASNGRLSMFSTFENPFGSHSRSSSNSRFSVVSGTSSLDSNGGTSRRVLQLFTPVLPDELLISTIGERLTVIQSFDDGWTLVGRESSGLVPMAKSLWKPASSENVELGVIPAWCFVKPCKGLRAERPVRTSSLGITVEVDAPPTSSRNDVMSWSNF